MFHWLEENTPGHWGGWPSGGRLFIATIVAVIGIGIVLVVVKRPKSDRPATWAQAMAGATGAMALFFVGYAIVPSEWIIWANSYWDMGDKTWLIVDHTKDIPLLGVNWPFDIPFSALEDLIVVVIYLAFFGLNLWLWAQWQKRGTVEAEETAEGVPTRRSRFGRPLKTTGA